MRPTSATVARFRESMCASAQYHLEKATSSIVEAKQRGGRVVVVTGSGPNLHEGVTTQIAELIHHGLVDGVITSSAVIAHEMAGTLDRVKRVNVSHGADSALSAAALRRDDVFEITCLSTARRTEMEKEFPEGWDLYDRLAALPGSQVIKAAGNMAWPMGLRT